MNQMVPPTLLAPITAITGPLEFDTKTLLQQFKRRALARGEPLLLAGDTCRNLYFLESGLLRHTRTVDGNVLTRWATLPGQYGLAFPSFVKQQPSEDGIEAYENCVLYELDHRAWAEMRREHAQLQRFWVAILEYTLCCFEDRVWSLISGDADQRYRYMIDRYPDFLLALPQHFVADMLGIAPRHLSRIRSAVRKG